ncbi:MAG: RluA family pseudouridine synthase [Acidobacteria bacterium]|nr:RluA family pseudouridine synthase [Acidobacteriota bacterium]
MEPGTKQVLTVPPEAHQARLDIYLTGVLAGHSRSQIQKLIRSGHVTVQGAPVKTGYQVQAGQRVSVQIPDERRGLPSAEDIPLAVVYEDADLAVIDKPAGMVCHAGAGVSRGTLVNALLHHFGGMETGDLTRPGIVHRLDKQTSGLLVVAKNLAAHGRLAAQFKQRQVRKEYLAVVYGRPRSDRGTLDWPLGRDPGDRKKFSTRARRSRAAITHYALERTLGPLSLLRVEIATGRTHQIRVHLARFGHPVVGDRLYGGARHKTLQDAPLRNAIGALERHLLHACRLEFGHPRSGRPMSFTSPPPPQFAPFLALA